MQINKLNNTKSGSIVGFPQEVASEDSVYDQFRELLEEVSSNVSSDSNKEYEALDVTELERIVLPPPVIRQAVNTKQDNGVDEEDQNVNVQASNTEKSVEVIDKDSQHEQSPEKKEQLKSDTKTVAKDQAEKTNNNSNLNEAEQKINEQRLAPIKEEVQLENVLNNESEAGLSVATSQEIILGDRVKAESIKLEGGANKLASDPNVTAVLDEIEEQLKIDSTLVSNREVTNTIKTGLLDKELKPKSELEIDIEQILRPENNRIDFSIPSEVTTTLIRQAMDALKIQASDKMQLKPGSNLEIGATLKAGQSKISAREIEAPQRLTKTVIAKAVERVAKAITDGAKNKENTISIRLDPPSLGNIDVHLSLKDKALSARIVAESPSTGQLLRDKAHEIISVLRKAGLEADEIKISFGGAEAVGVDVNGQGAFSSEFSEHKDNELELGTGSHGAFHEHQGVEVKQVILQEDHWVA